MISAIAKSVKAVMPDFNVYVNSISQNAEFPTIFVNVGRMSIENELSGMRKITVQISINAIISHNSSTQERYDVMNEIMTGLEYIEYENKKIRCVEKSISSDNDGKLIMTANISFRIGQQDEQELMETLYHKMFIKVNLSQEG